MSNSSKEKLVVIGAAESGIGAALLAQSKGYEVFVSDYGVVKQAYKEQLTRVGIPYEEGGHTLSRIADAGLIVKSPGVPGTVPVLQKAVELGIPVVSEIEFGWTHYNGKVIGITGSNGKTTTTLLTHHLIASAGLHAGIAGNVGKSFAASLCAPVVPSMYVLEVSSFQLDDCYTFAPHIAMILNITPDHLDRYQNRFELYAAAKMRIIQQATDSTWCIFQQESTPVTERLLALQSPARLLPVSMFPIRGVGGFVSMDDLVYRLPDTEEIRIPYDSLPLSGQHNRYNMLAAGLAALLTGVTPRQLEEGLQSFANAPHRLEWVGSINDVHYINDSKATNVDSVYYALESMKTPVVWIAGGVDKGNDYTQIEELVRTKVKALICMGKDNSPLERFFIGKVPVIRSTGSIREALEVSAREAVKGDTVLLSPACASFDLFRNYEDRGDQFRQLVQAFIQQKTGNA
jgi:UDP-N-acetylmuramoylalanine--D-glutamate ligase